MIMIMNLYFFTALFLPASQSQSLLCNFCYISKIERKLTNTRFVSSLIPKNEVDVPENLIMAEDKNKKRKALYTLSKYELQEREIFLQQDKFSLQQKEIVLLENELKSNAKGKFIYLFISIFQSC